MSSADVYAVHEAHRMACEVRLVLTWKLADRQDYLAGVEERRGPEAAKALRDAIAAEWRRRRTDKTPHTD